MREIVKGMFSVLIHFAAGMICCVLYIFFFKKPEVLPQFLTGWKITESAILFIEVMPGLLVSAILLGYAVIFGTCGQNTVSRYSSILLQYLKEAFIILFFCITGYILLIELVLPMLFKRQNRIELKTRDYYEYIEDVDMLIKNNRAEQAYRKVKAALEIWPGSPDALQQLDAVKVLRGAQTLEWKQLREHETAHTDADPENITAEGALFMAKRFMERLDFYTAHFYAMKAYRLSTETAPYRGEAIRLAAQAWNQIEKGIAELTADFDIRLYRAKRAGYEMMQQGDFIKAYYQFIEAQQMIEQNDALQHDPDIDRFVAVTKEKLLEEVFFIDETETLSLSESLRDIHFTIPASEFDAVAEIRIDELSFVSDNGIKEIYGRNCEITQYGADNRVQYRYRVPFMKVIPISAPDGRPVLRMLFQAVDKQHDKVILKPIPLAGTMPVNRNVSKVLPFSYNDFELIIAANAGAKTMTLPQLYSFRRYGAQYGFPARIYHREILMRIADIFLILIISVFMLVLAWSFRTPPHQQFRNSWALSFPVFFVMITGFMEMVRYAARLLIAFFTDTIYPFSTALLVLVYTLLFIGVSFLFFAQRSEA